MKSNKVTKKASLALLSLFIGAAAWAQEGSTINYFLSPEAWQGVDSNNTAVAESDYTKVTSNGNKMYVNIRLPDAMASGGASEYKVSDINSFSITTRQAAGSSDVQNAYFNIYTQKGEGSSSTNWYESRLNSEPYYATNLEKYTGAGNWYTWSTEDKGDNAYLTIYDSSPNVGANGAGGFQGAYGVGATVDQLKSGEVSITKPSDTPFSKDYSQEKLDYISINVNDTKNNMSNPGLDIKSFNMNLAGQDYAWNFLGAGSTWNVTSGNQISADKVSDMTVNVSGEGTTLTTQAGLSNSFVNVSNSGTANISDATLSGMETTAEWNNGQNYTSKPLFSVSSSGNLNISDSEFSDNKVTHTGSLNSGVGAQGIITLSDASISVSNTTFSNNKSENVPGEAVYSAPTTQGSVLYAANAKDANFTDVNFVNNTAKGPSVQGGAIAGFGGNYSIKGGSFEGNVSDATGFEDGEAYGAAGYFAGNSWSDPKVAMNLEVNGTSFKNNQTQGTWAYGGALYVNLGTEGSSFKISDSSFEGNKTVGAEDSLAGALYINGGSATVENTSFNGNSASVGEAGAEISYNGGGALVVRNSNVKISATKDISNVGNYYELAGAKDDSRGGFMFLRGTSTVDFDIAEGATYTVGDGTAGQDSIASEASDASQHVINKTGAGTLTLNGSMADYKGVLNVTEGTMNVNNGLGGEANVSGAELNISKANYDGLSLVKPANGSPTAIVNATAGADLSLSDSSFTNNTVSTEGTANGTYGVAVGINSSNASIDNVVFENNTSKSTGSLMSQGVVYLTISDSTSITNSKFIGNKSESENSYAMGGAVSSWGSNLNIENTTFSGNSVKGASADGAAVYVAGNDWGGSNPSIVNISNSTFDGNVSEGSDIARGAGVFAGGDNVNTLIVNITDSVFTNNVAKGNDYVAGGAISVQDQMVNINVTKDMTYAGNQAIVNGVADDSKGGFLFINSKNVSSDTTFNISDGATLTIGDGREGYDSIASRDEKAIINKTGAGTLTINSSMANYKGDLNVNEGTLNLGVVPVNTSIANNISVAAGATLNTNYGERATNWMTLQAGKTLDVSGTWQHSYQVGIQEGSTFTLRDGGKADLGYLAFGGKAVIEGDLIVGKSAGDQINFGGTTSEEYGKSEMTIQNGGTATFATNVNVGHRKGDDGISKDAIINVNEGGSFTVSEGDLNIGSSNVTAGNVSSGEGYFNVNGGSVSVAGNINVGTKNTGLLSVNGGNVSAGNINIGSFGKMSLAIDSASTAQYQVNSAIANAGELILQAKLGTSETKSFNVASGGISGEGLISAYGGVYENNVFTINAKVVNSDITSATSVDAGSIVTINSDSSIESAAKSVSIATSSDSITVNSAELADHNDADFMGDISLASNENLMAAWAFDVLGVDQDNTVVLSFAIGDGFDLSDIGVYQREGDVWTNVTGDLDALSLSDGVLSFIADSMSDYALTVVPEPSTYAFIFGALALVFVISRKRK